jgi:hypothetical protein
MKFPGMYSVTISGSTTTNLAFGEAMDAVQRAFESGKDQVKIVRQ